MNEEDLDEEERKLLMEEAERFGREGATLSDAYDQLKPRPQDYANFDQRWVSGWHEADPRASQSLLYKPIGVDRAKLIGDELDWNFDPTETPENVLIYAMLGEMKAQIEGSSDTIMTLMDKLVGNDSWHATFESAAKKYGDAITAVAESWF